MDDHRVQDFTFDEPENAQIPANEAGKSAFEKICVLLRVKTGHEFSLYKQSTIYRRIERRMDVHQINHIGEYVVFLRNNPQEVDLLFKEMLIGVTSFFRDPAAWAYLQEAVFPGMIRATTGENQLRAWVAGCSSGEEAYTLAIIFREAIDHAKPDPGIDLRIFATDLDPDAITKARQGYYPASIANDVSPERLARFFVKDNGRFRISSEIRQMVVFASHNVTMDPPFTRLDILSCRNLLIYLGSDLQKRSLRLFHYSLKSGGILFLGSAERIGNFDDLFSPLEAKARIYRREETKQIFSDADFPTRHTGDATLALLAPGMPPETLQTLSNQLLLHKFSPPAVMTNANGDILFINGQTEKYLEPSAGKANWNIHAMARQGLRQALSIAFQQALQSSEAVLVKNLSIEDGGGKTRVDVAVLPISEPPPISGMTMVVFTDIPPPESGHRATKQSARQRLSALEQSLLKAEETVRNIRKEMQTSRKALKAANEALQSTNDKQQSANNELATAGEKMRSLNEALQAVNAKIQSKIDAWPATSDDLKNLLNCTGIAAIFLDDRQQVLRFSSQATGIFKLIPSDIHRPLADIVHTLDYPGMHDDIQQVLRTQSCSARQIASNDGGWYIVRIMPCRMSDNDSNGVTMTFTDISQAKKLETELRAC